MIFFPTFATVKIQSHLAKEKDAWLSVDPVVIVTNYVARVLLPFAVSVNKNSKYSWIISRSLWQFGCRLLEQNLLDTPNQSQDDIFLG